MADTEINKDKLIYEGKAKTLYSTKDPELIIQYFKDDATAFNNVKKDNIANKGILNNFISHFIMERLNENNIPTHFVKRIDNRHQLVKKVNIIPLEVVIRNVAAGSISKRLGIEEGTKLKKPLIEFYYKDDSLGDPLVTDDHILIFNWATNDEINILKKLALDINKILTEIFIKANINLVDFKLEFGKTKDGNIILADEISPDSCRLWDKDTGQKLDKDIFRRDLGDLTAGYSEVARRLNIKIED